jgi:hypothetical protein
MGVEAERPDLIIHRVTDNGCYGQEAARLPVVRNVDCSLRGRKRRAISKRFDSHPFRQIVVQHNPRKSNFSLLQGIILKVERAAKSSSRLVQNLKAQLGAMTFLIYE